MREGRSARTTVGWLLLLAVGAGLRVAAAFESFWFDEAWSWTFAQRAGGPLGVLLLAHDNNHILNTWWLLGLGPDAPVVAYRGLALAAGVASLPLFFAIAARFGRAEAWVALALAAVSHPLVLFSAQARGYGPAIGLSLGFFVLLRSEIEAPSRWRPPLLWAVAALGLLAHATFVYPLGAAALWLLARWALGDASLRRTAAIALWTLAVPGALLLALGTGFYARMAIGGGPERPLAGELAQFLASVVGLPARGVFLPVASVAALGLVGAGLVSLRRDPARAWAFLAAALGAVPAAVVVVADPALFYARYLQLALPWALLAIAAALGRGLRAGGPLRAASIALLATLLAGHAALDLRMLASGRGDYARTVRYLAEQTDGPVIAVGGDHDGRHRVLLRFHARALPTGKRIVYHRAGHWPAGGPPWYLRHSWQAGPRPEPSIRVAGVAYRLVQSYEHGPGPGFRWYVYRKVDR